MASGGAIWRVCFKVHCHWERALPGPEETRAGNECGVTEGDIAGEGDTGKSRCEGTL